MGGFKLGKMTLSGLFKQPETIQYPVQKKEPPGGPQGPRDQRHGRVHPVRASARSAAPRAPSWWTSRARTWSIDRFRCVQCGSCVRECPKQCLAMEPTYTSPGHLEVRRHLRGAREGEDGVANARLPGARCPKRRAQRVQCPRNRWMWGHFVEAGPSGPPSRAATKARAGTRQRTGEGKDIYR